MVQPLSVSSASLINILQKVRDGATNVPRVASADHRGGPFVLHHLLHHNHLLQSSRAQQPTPIRLQRPLHLFKQNTTSGMEKPPRCLNAGRSAGKDGLDVSKQPAIPLTKKGVSSYSRTMMLFMQRQLSFNVAQSS